MATTTISGNKLEIFLTNEDILKLKGLVSSSQPQSPQIVEQSNGNNSYFVEPYGDGTKVSWIIAGGSGNYSYKLVDKIYQGNMNAPKNVNWDVEVIDNASNVSYKVKVDTNQRGLVNFNGTGIEIKETVETPTTPPVVVQVETPNTSNNYAVMLNVGQEVQIKEGKVLFQVSSHSFTNGDKGNNIGASHSILSKNGKLICDIKSIDDNILEGAHTGNNHMNGFNVVCPTGEIDLYYNNITKKDAIYFGIGEIHNNDGYLFYKNGGLKTALFYKKLEIGESLSKSFNLIEADDYGKVSALGDNTLHKQVNINFYKNGKLHTSEMEIQYGDGTYYFYQGYVHRINSSETITVRSKNNHNENITLKVTVGGYGQTGVVKVLSSNGGLQIAEEGIKISKYNFNFKYRENDKIQYSIKEGIKGVTYKMFNNYRNPLYIN